MCFHGELPYRTKHLCISFWLAIIHNLFVFFLHQINAGTVLAMRYNDQSPLENHHTAVAFDLLSHKEVDPFSHLSTTIRQRIRKGVIR